MNLKETSWATKSSIFTFLGDYTIYISVYFSSDYQKEKKNKNLFTQLAQYILKTYNNILYSFLFKNKITKVRHGLIIITLKIFVYLILNT